MKNRLNTILLIGAFALGSCNSVPRNIFAKKTQHEAYADKLEDKGLDETPEGKQWIAAAGGALAAAQPISLPYRHEGHFGTDKARALGLRFTAKQGQQLRFHILKENGVSFVLYADVFKANGGDKPVFSSDTAVPQFEMSADETGEYILRLQPELFRGGSYTVTISTGPSLGFPVPGKSAKAGSFWGADRDGGKRSHEGVDIFAPKRTPVVAAADGYVTGVREGGIGGKVVWMRPSGSNLSLYYAHLDEQLVKEGQFVKAGETLGLVGNTGNARTTPPHLHFGIYTYGGAVDPFPFIDPAVKRPPTVPDKKLGVKLKLKKALKDGNTILAQQNTEVLPLAVNNKGYIAELPDGRLVLTPFASVKS